MGAALEADLAMAEAEAALTGTLVLAMDPAMEAPATALATAALVLDLAATDQDQAAVVRVSTGTSPATVVVAAAVMDRDPAVAQVALELTKMATPFELQGQMRCWASAFGRALLFLQLVTLSMALCSRISHCFGSIKMDGNANWRSSSPPLLSSSPVSSPLSWVKWCVIRNGGCGWGRHRNRVKGERKRAGPGVAGWLGLGSFYLSAVR